MEFKSYKEIVEQIEKEEQEYIEVISEMELLLDLPFSIRIWTRNELKERLKRIDNNISFYLNLINKFTTFEREDWFLFVAEYLPLAEQEEIVLKEFKKEYSENGKTRKHTFWDELLYLDLTEVDYLVSTQEDCEKIQERFKEENIKSAINSTNIQKYLLFSSEEEIIQLAYNKSINKKYECFSSLQIAFERLIDLGLQNPEMTPKERLDIVLKEARKIEVKRNLTM